MNIFLQAATIRAEDLIAGGGALGAIAALLVAFLVFFIILAIAVYVYTSFAFMAIARKTKTEPAGLAWIPVIGPLLISSKIAEMHWWPILLLIGFWIPFLNILLMITLAVFSFIWMWKTFEAVGKPGWWILLNLIPIAGGIIFLILLGVAAWGKK